MNKDPFQEYIKQTEPNKREKRYAWHTAIGLQAVDGLKPSEYLINTAIQNIEGKLQKYYRKKLSVLRRMNIYQSIRNFSQVFINMPGKSEIIILQKKNGC